MPRRLYTILAIAACLVALGATGCDSGKHRTASNDPAKHTVLVDASLGFGAFHRFISIPARTGRFSDPVSPAAKQGVAAARFASRELRVAARHVQGSKRLQVLFAPLQLTADKIRALGGALSQHSSLAQIEAINQVLRRIAAAASDNGARIVDAPASRIAAAGGPHA